MLADPGSVRKAEKSEGNGGSSHNPYLQDHAGWSKIRNRAYTQWAGREKLFERERETILEINYWDTCTAACQTLGL